jgi:hypothetical protein
MRAVMEVEVGPWSGWVVRPSDRPVPSRAAGIGLGRMSCARTPFPASLAYQRIRAERFKLGLAIQSRAFAPVDRLYPQSERFIHDDILS